MYRNIYIISIGFFILLFFSCKDSTKIEKDTIKVSIESVNPDDSKELIDDLLTQIDSAQIENDKKSEHDCIFDQSTQTDEFLKGIIELEDYVWYPETQTAEIVLNDHWFLTLKRGGCDDFEMSASFMYDRILDIEKDKKQIFDNVIWITSLLEEFDGESIKRTIQESKVSISKQDEFNFYANFMDEKLYELYYFNFNNKDKTTFEVGYYYN